MKAKFSGYKEKVLNTFYKQGVIYPLGIEIVDFGEGWFHASMPQSENISQQHGYVSAGALSTLADISSGYAAYSLVEEDEEILTIEYKINFLRPAVGDKFNCYAKVLKPGRSICVAEAEIYGVKDGGESLIAKAFITLAVKKM